MDVLVRGAGVAGLSVAHELWSRGVQVTVVDPQIGKRASWYAGGMLAPYCERESAEQPVVDLGQNAADWWEAALPGSVSRKGTLVLAASRDIKELDRFGSRTSHFEVVDETAIATLEPDLVGRFRKGLFFTEEAHLDPRHVLINLVAKLVAAGVSFETDLSQSAECGFDDIIDCTGYSVTNENLRGVRGEMLILRTADVSLSRPIRLIHPRFPVYVVPRQDHTFMVGATMIESDAAGPITARSMMELLNTAYSLHPAFGEAEIVETGTGIRPAYPDNLPRVTAQGNTITVNGLYRHGFLLAPAMAVQAATAILERRSEIR
ncbi:glycine oxidase ThiO [Phyllobacterium brassicacearum]|uniref:Glycine oxidase ThiO n=1 Tax=Phyllobacterium brassicacearum TaxID=314235 RepID=A0A2P7BTQ0_9HYPH|nr:glycine oxidase ThiO [Phyllobacterium brassicacearum]PSH69864.1 glycine oxidase ThiO [Phyllobacterium brassicacearum]TDQ35033.1 glycine oxidase [Phyllobacterium brassicacearum]